ncbi:hypothetical protein [Amphritea sp.]|uniref:hypothetical protein n=1 Tax=Amphritea sp. TaxID=1872502 RepID=UPI003D0E62DE
MSEVSNDCLTITCPSCDGETRIRAIGNNAGICKSCQTNLYGRKFKQVKQLSQGLIALSCLLGGAGINEVMTETRLPALAEYRLMDLCVNGDSRVLKKSIYSNKQEICSCIVTKAVEDIDLTWKVVSAERYTKWLFDSMKEAAPQCR